MAEALPLKLAAARTSYGSAPGQAPAVPKGRSRGLRLRNVAVGLLSMVAFGALIGICLDQIWTNDLALGTTTADAVNLQATGGDEYRRLIHAYHTDRRKGSDYEGDCTTVKHDHNKGLEECFLKCKADRGCKSFSFDVRSKKCCGSTSSQPGYYVQGHTNWYMMPVFGPECKHVDVYSNTMRQSGTGPSDWNGGKGSVMSGCTRTKTLETCMSKCVSSPSCKAFNYARTGGMCCGSTTSDPGPLGMGVDFYILPAGQFDHYNPEQDCYHQQKQDVTAGGTASLSDLFDTTHKHKKAAHAKKSAKRGTVVEAIVTRVAHNAAAAAKDAGSLKEFVKELLPEKFGLKVGASSINVDQAQAARMTSRNTRVGAAAGTHSSTTGGSSLPQPVRHVHGSIPTSYEPVASHHVSRANGAAAATPAAPATRFAAPAPVAPKRPAVAAALPHVAPIARAPVPAAPTSLRQQQRQAPAAVPADAHTALAEAQKILADAEARAAALIASASNPGAPSPMSELSSSRNGPQIHEIVRH